MVTSTHGPEPSATMTADAARQALLQLRATGDRARFVDLAWRYLEAIDDDPEIALQLLKALVEDGLGEPARELLARRRELAADRVDVAALTRALDGVPSGRVDPDTLSPVFERNLEALLDGRPHLEGLAETLRDALDDHELFRDRAGGLHLSRADGGRHWVPGYHDPVDPAELPPPGPAVAVSGTGLTNLPRLVLESAGPVPVFLVDDSVVLFSAWLHMADHTAMLRDDRLAVFAGPGALADLEAFLVQREDYLLPETHLSPPWAASLGRDVVQLSRDLATLRGRTLEQLTGRHADRARTRCREAWAGRLEPGAAIVGFASRGTTMLQYSMRDIGHALEALGYRFHMLIEKADHCRHSTLTTSRAIVEHDPALVVLINHFRHEQPHTFGDTPILSWLQDPTEVVLSRRTGESLAPHDFVCGYYQRRCTGEFGYPPRRFFPEPLPASERVFHDAAIDGGSAYACDVMYVGHLHATADELVAQWRGQTPARLHPTLDEIRAAVTTRHETGEPLDLHAAGRLVRELADGHGLDATQLEHLANYYAFRLYDTLFRQRTLHWVARWAQRTERVFRLYGSGWSRDPLLEPHAVGAIEHGESLRQAYRGATLTIQTLPTGFKHQRAYEALLSGSLVIGPSIAADFSGTGSARSFPRLDEVVFAGESALGGLADTLLECRETRDGLQQAFADVVRREFTYHAVLDRVLGKVRQCLGDAG